MGAEQKLRKAHEDFVNLTAKRAAEVERGAVLEEERESSRQGRRLDGGSASAKIPH
jgi:hypothetical protein